MWGILTTVTSHSMNQNRNVHSAVLTPWFPNLVSICKYKTNPMHNPLLLLKAIINLMMSDFRLSVRKSQDFVNVLANVRRIDHHVHQWLYSITVISLIATARRRVRPKSRRRWRQPKRCGDVQLLLRQQNVQGEWDQLKSIGQEDKSTFAHLRIHTNWVSE